MLKALLLKLRESAISVLPVTLIVLLLRFTPLISLSAGEMAAFLSSAVVLFFGMALFNLGADMAMTPMGEQVGAGLSRSKRLWLLFAVCFAMGVFITVAEPDLSVLAAQVSDVLDGTALIVTVGVGVGLGEGVGVDSFFTISTFTSATSPSMTATRRAGPIGAFSSQAVPFQ